MKRRLKRLGLKGRFPLLRKELTEQAARTRTYVVRLLYALVLFLIFCLLFRSQLQRAGPDPQNILGWGAGVFKQVMYLQFGALYVFLPAIMSGVLTIEKERDSLALLFLTDLRPWEITLEKYFGRLIPMFTFLLLSLPLMGLAYSMGGISTNMLVNGAFLLLLACLQVGAVSLMFSAYCRSTVSSFLASYLIGVTLCNIPPFSAVFFFGMMNNESPVLVALSSVGIFASIACFLLLAKRFLVQRAFLPPVNATLQFFRGLDSFWQYLNRFAGGVILIKDKTGLPKEQPVFWRETTKKSLGKINYLFRILVAVETPILFIAVGMSMLGGASLSEIQGLSWMLFVLWFAGMLAIAVRSADLVVSERANQTLEVLLTTPVGAAQIIRQKMQAVWRLILILWGPLLSVVLMEGIFEREMRREGYELGFIGYLASSLLMLAIYPPLFAWLSLWIGLKARSRGRAIILAVAVLLLWCAVPPALAWVVDATNILAVDKDLGAFFLLLSPATALAVTELHDAQVAVRPAPLLLLLAVNGLFYAGLLYGIRRRCLSRADAYLRHDQQTGRVEDEQELLALERESG